MNVTVEAVSDVQKRIRVDIPSENVTKELDNFYRKVKKSAQIKGFRPGKAPRSVLERYYGAQAQQEVISELIGKAYPQILEDEKIEAVADPDVETAEIGDDGVLTFVALIATRPVFEPQGYKGLAVDRKKVAVTDAEIDEQINQLREQNAQMAPVEEDRPIAAGDYVDINFEGFLEGVAFPGGKADGYLLEIGSNTFIPGFEEQLVGAKAGEEKDLKVTFPEGYGNKELAGKEVVFKVKVNGIKQRELPEIDDELAKSLDGAGVNTLTELREFLEKQLTEQKENEASREMRQALAAKLVDANAFEIPAVLIDRQFGHVVETAKQQLVYGGIPAQQAEMLIENRRDEYRAEAERQVRFSMIVDRIAELEKIEVGDEELGRKLEEISRLSDKPIEAIRAEYLKEDRMEMLRGRLRDEKVIDIIVESAEVTLVDPPAENAGEGTAPDAETEKEG